MTRFLLAVVLAGLLGSCEKKTARPGIYLQQNSNIYSLGRSFSPVELEYYTYSLVVEELNPEQPVYISARSLDELINPQLLIGTSFMYKQHPNFTNTIVGRSDDATGGFGIAAGPGLQEHLYIDSNSFNYFSRDRLSVRANGQAVINIKRHSTPANHDYRGFIDHAILVAHDFNGNEVCDEGELFAANVLIVPANQSGR